MFMQTDLLYTKLNLLNKDMLYTIYNLYAINYIKMNMPNNNLIVVRMYIVLGYGMLQHC